MVEAGGVEPPSEKTECIYWMKLRLVQTFLYFLLQNLEFIQQKDCSFAFRFEMQWMTASFKQMKWKFCDQPEKDAYNAMVSGL